MKITKWLAAFGAGLALTCCSPWAAGDVVSDAFSGPSLDAAKWQLPPYTVGTGVLTQTNSRLEFTASITLGGAAAEANVESKAAGTQVANWYVEVSATLSGPFPDMGSSDVVSPTLNVRPSGPDSWAGGEDRFEISCGFTDLANFGGSGFGYGLHQGSKTNGVETSVVVSLGNAGPQSLRFRVEYDALSGKLKALYDAGSGFAAFGTETDTGGWGMGLSETFRIGLHSTAENMDGETAAGTFSVESGQSYFDDFTASGDGIVIIPEPAGLSLALLSLAMIRVASRRVLRRTD